ncbi:MAG: PepSY domain-containing protein [Chloroflexia bacterium]
MKIKRSLTLAAITLLLAGALGLFGYRAFAQSEQPAALNWSAAGQIEDKDDKGDGVIPAGIPITANQAQATAEKANPGTATIAVEFDREGGKDIWEVELNNGLDVQVDANSGDIILTEVRDSD